MGDDEFDDQLDDYLSGIGLPNPEMVDVEIVWVRGNPALGSDHIAAHDVTEAEVEEVLFEVPPDVEAKRHPDAPERTIFWGATRAGRWLFVSSEDWTDGGTRYLKPITAFEPEEGEEYWSQQ
ncbi:MAG TPA: hypothetical protein VGJ05_11385 [Fimbriiglobus sp.]|jgi:hypothetical protein